MKEYTSFKDFYPYYLSEHQKKHTKLMHFIGTTLYLYCAIHFVFSFDFMFVLYGLICGYGFAWISHFFIEKNKPATFRYPMYSFMADHVMYFEILLGKHAVL